MKLLTLFIGCFLIVISFQMRLGGAAPTDLESLEESAYLNISKRQSTADLAQIQRDLQFHSYTCRLRSIALRAAELRYSMPVSLFIVYTIQSFR